MEKFLKDWGPYILVLVAVILIRSFVVTPVIVDGPSMNQTLYNGDVVILNKLAKNSLKHGDIVVVKRGNSRLIKRLLAMPLEKIKCVSGIIYVNNEEIDDSHAYGKTANFQEVILGEDQYFVVGDNREDSLDSRSFGPVSKDDIVGTVGLRLFPFNSIGGVS